MPVIPDESVPLSNEYALCVIERALLQPSKEYYIPTVETHVTPEIIISRVDYDAYNNHKSDNHTIMIIIEFVNDINEYFGLK